MSGDGRLTRYLLALKNAVEEGGIDALIEKNRKKPKLKNRIDPEIEKTVVSYALDFPAHGQARTSNELRKKRFFVSPGGVRSIRLRHELSNFKNRLKALEDKVAKEGLVLIEAQVQALEQKKDDDEACMEIANTSSRLS